MAKAEEAPPGPNVSAQAEMHARSRVRARGEAALQAVHGPAPRLGERSHRRGRHEANAPSVGLRRGSLASRLWLKSIDLDCLSNKSHALSRAASKPAGRRRTLLDKGR